MRIRGSLGLGALEKFQRRVGAAVIDEEELHLARPVPQRGLELLKERRDILLLVVNGNDDAQRIAFHLPPQDGQPCRRHAPPAINRSSRRRTAGGGKSATRGGLVIRADSR